HPGGEISLEKGGLGQALARLRQHVGRGINAYDVRGRKPVDQKFRRITGSASQIDDARRPVERHLCEQIARRPRALVLELEILPSTPVFGHGSAHHASARSSRRSMRSTRSLSRSTRTDNSAYL